METKDKTKPVRNFQYQRAIRHYNGLHYQKQCLPTVTVSMKANGWIPLSAVMGAQKHQEDEEK